MSDQTRYIGPGVRFVFRGKRGERRMHELPCAIVKRRCVKCRRSDLYCACAS